MIQWNEVGVVFPRTFFHGLGTSQTRRRHLRRANRNGVIGGTGVWSIFHCIKTYTLKLVFLCRLFSTKEGKIPLLAMVFRLDHGLSALVARSISYPLRYVTRLFLASMPYCVPRKGREKKEKRKKTSIFSSRKDCFTRCGAVDQ